MFIFIFIPVGEILQKAIFLARCVIARVTSKPLFCSRLPRLLRLRYARPLCYRARASSRDRQRNTVLRRIPRVPQLLSVVRNYPALSFSRYPTAQPVSTWNDDNVRNETSHGSEEAAKGLQPTVAMPSREEIRAARYRRGIFNEKKREMERSTKKCKENGEKESWSEVNALHIGQYVLGVIWWRILQLTTSHRVPNSIVFSIRSTNSNYFDTKLPQVFLPTRSFSM